MAAYNIQSALLCKTARLWLRGTLLIKFAARKALRIQASYSYIKLNRIFEQKIAFCCHWTILKKRKKLIIINRLSVRVWFLILIGKAARGVKVITPMQISKWQRAINIDHQFLNTLRSPTSCFHAASGFVSVLQSHGAASIMQKIQFTSDASDVASITHQPWCLWLREWVSWAAKNKQLLHSLRNDFLVSKDVCSAKLVCLVEKREPNEAASGAPTPWLITFLALATTLIVGFRPQTYNQNASNKVDSSVLDTRSEKACRVRELRYCWFSIFHAIFSVCIYHIIYASISRKLISV